MDQDDPREEIARLEGEIEDFAATIESCRKIILASQTAIAGGGVAPVYISPKGTSWVPLPPPARPATPAPEEGVPGVATFD